MTMRGNRMWRRGAVWALVLPMLAPLAWADDKPPAEDIIEKSIKAAGGREAMEKMTSRVTHGTFSIPAMNVKGPLVTYEKAPNFTYTVIDIEGMGRIESGCDGETYWELTAMMGPRVIEGDERAFQERLTRFNASLHWKDYYTKAETLGVEELDGKKVYKLAMTPKVGEVETSYFDTQTYLPVKAEFTITGPMGTVPLVVQPEDFRKVDGLVLPHKVIQTIAQVQQIVVTIDKIEHNVDIPADRFALPAPVKELRDKPAKTAPATEPAKP